MLTGTAFPTDGCSHCGEEETEEQVFTARVSMFGLTEAKIIGPIAYPAMPFLELLDELKADLEPHTESESHLLLNMGIPSWGAGANPSWHWARGGGTPCTGRSANYCTTLEKNHCPFVAQVLTPGHSGCFLCHHHTQKPQKPCSKCSCQGETNNC